MVVLIQTLTITKSFLLIIMRYLLWLPKIRLIKLLVFFVLHFAGCLKLSHFLIVLFFDLSFPFNNLLLHSLFILFSFSHLIIIIIWQSSFFLFSSFYNSINLVFCISNELHKILTFSYLIFLFHHLLSPLLCFFFI